MNSEKQQLEIRSSGPWQWSVFDLDGVTKLFTTDNIFAAIRWRFLYERAEENVV